MLDQGAPSWAEGASDIRAVPVSLEGPVKGGLRPGVGGRVGGAAVQLPAAAAAAAAQWGCRHSPVTCQACPARHTTGACAALETWMRSRAATQHVGTRAQPLVGENTARKRQGRDEECVDSAAEQVYCHERSW